MKLEKKRLDNINRDLQSRLEDFLAGRKSYLIRRYFDCSMEEIEKEHRYNKKQLKIWKTLTLSQKEMCESPLTYITILTQLEEEFVWRTFKDYDKFHQEWLVAHNKRLKEYQEEIDKKIYWSVKHTKDLIEKQREVLKRKGANAVNKFDKQIKEII